MARHVEQTELPLTRARTPLLELEEETPLRLPKAVAKAAVTDPAAAVKALSDASIRMLEEITEKNAAMGQVLIDGQLRPMPPNQVESRQGWPVNENPERFTPWSDGEKPHWQGFYDVTDHETGTLNARWWWDGVYWHKGDPAEARATGIKLTLLRHQGQFDTQYSWRGLRAAEWPYLCPPYSSKLLPPGAPTMVAELPRQRTPLLG